MAPIQHINMFWLAKKGELESYREVIFIKCDLVVWQNNIVKDA